MDNPDFSHHWLPFTANRAFASDPRLLTKAEGVYYLGTGGRKLLDGVSGLFCVPAGHCRPEIAAAIGGQAKDLDFAPPFQFAHPLGFQLADRLAALLPTGLDRLFFVNSGSEAVETALKGALAYHRARGEGTRTRLVGRERAYHGVNFGGLSVSGMARNRSVYGPLLPEVSHIRATWSPDEVFTQGQPETGAERADDLQRVVDLYGAENIAAVVVEPISGSTGILVPPRGYLERLAAIARANGILVIFDEVITGFGRTGRPFASETFGVTPDIITMAKALTNGAVPMGAVAFSREVHEAVTSAARPGAIEFPHGYTWSAHPLACAAALAALRLYEQEALFDRAARLAPMFQQGLLDLKGAGPITDIRGYGLLGGIDLEPEGTPGQRGAKALKSMFRSGLVARVTNDTVILAPPFVSTEAQLAEMLEVVRNVVAGL